jgi:hypothetical protein
LNIVEFVVKRQMHSSPVAKLWAETPKASHRHTHARFAFTFGRAP